MHPTVYRPGAGHQPLYLAGREEELEAWLRSLGDIAVIGRAGARDTIFTGPRGVGKTVLMGRCAEEARTLGYEVIDYQAAAGNDGLIAAIANQAAKQLDAEKSVWRKARAAFANLAGVSFGLAGMSASVELRSAPPQRFSRDPSDLADALASLAEAVTAERPAGGVLVTIDELQVAPAADLTLLAAALQRLNINHPNAHVAFAATALPHVEDVLDDAGVTHPDRLFDIRKLPLTLTQLAAEQAITQPAISAGVVWQPAAIHAVINEAGAYPATLQVLADAVWRSAPGPSLITLEDAQPGLQAGSAEIRERSLERRWDTLTGQQQAYLAAIAQAGGQATTAQVLTALGKSDASELSTVRQQLIQRGDVYAPKRGIIALAVPAMTDYVREQLQSRTVLDTLNASFPQLTAPTPLPPQRPHTLGHRAANPENDTAR